MKSKEMKNEEVNAIRNFFKPQRSQSFSQRTKRKLSVLCAFFVYLVVKVADEVK